MHIYELIEEMNSSSLIEHWDNLPGSFEHMNRAKLEDVLDLEVFDLFNKVYSVRIIYKSDREDGGEEFELNKYGDEGMVHFSATELRLINNLDWSRLPHNLKAYVYDVIWICNRKYEAAIIAADEYYVLYHEWFDEVNWVQCVDYVSRAIELVAKIGCNEKKEYFLSEVYNDIVRLNGDDPLFLSISLIELIISQNYICDYKALIPLTDKLIRKNEGSVSTARIMEQAYYAKASIYKKLKDKASENAVYVQYADVLAKGAEKYVKVYTDENNTGNISGLALEFDIKKAIKLFQTHGALEKAVSAQKLLIDVQKIAVEHMEINEFKFDVTDSYKIFCKKYENRNIQDLIWDVIFAFGFQNKSKIRDDVTKNSSIISSLFPTQIIGSEGQIEFTLPSLRLDDENSILLNMYHKAKEYETIQGQTFGVWFIQLFKKLDLQETDLDYIFENNPITPKGQGKDIQKGIYYGLTGRMSDAVDKLAPKVESIIRNLAEMCGDLVTYYDPEEGFQNKRVLSQIFKD